MKILAQSGRMRGGGHLVDVDAHRRRLGLAISAPPGVANTPGST